MLQKANDICSRITMRVLNTEFYLRVERDNKEEYLSNGRVFLQVVYFAPCTKTKEFKEWHGRKWYLSEHMTEDEVVKTAWCALEAAVKHETMEGFKVDGIILFNPHINFEALLRVSHEEVKRELQNQEP